MKDFNIPFTIIDRKYTEKQLLYNTFTVICNNYFKGHKTWYKATLIHKVYYWCKDRQMGQWNIIKKSNAVF